MHVGSEELVCAVKSYKNAFIQRCFRVPGVATDRTLDGKAQGASRFLLRSYRWRTKGHSFRRSLETFDKLLRKLQAVQLEGTVLQIPNAYRKTGIFFFSSLPASLSAFLSLGVVRLLPMSRT